MTTMKNTYNLGVWNYNELDRQHHWF